MKRCVVDFRFYNHWLKLKQFFMSVDSNSPDKRFSADDILSYMENIEKENSK